MVVKCLKASSPPPPPKTREKPPLPGVHLRGLSVTITHTHRHPAAGLPHPERETGFPRTPPACHKSPTDLAKASPTQSFRGRGEFDIPRQEERPQREAEGAKDDAEAQPFHQPPQGNVEKPLWYLTTTTAAILLIQGLFIILFTAFVRYDELADASHPGNNHHYILGGNLSKHNPGGLLHHQLLNMEIVVLAGVGLRMAFLREYSYSSVGVSLLLTAMTLQWAILCRWFITDKEFMYISIYSLLEGCVVSVSVGVTHGALLGVASPLQLVLLTLLQVPVHTATHHLVNNIIQAVDRGGSLSVHMFGAVFGVSACRALGGRRSATTTRLSASKTSQVAAFIGTMVMVVYLPEVWSWRSSGDDQHRAQINTLLATLAAAIVALPASSIAHTRRKFSMSDIQCGVMGGSVAVAAVADMMLEAYGALLLGAITSAICVLTRRRLAPMLQTRLGVADTAGVGVSHGLAGAMGGLAGVVMAASASDKGSYGVSVYEIFPPMAPKESTPELAEVVSYYVVPAGKGRSSGSQAAHQLAAILAVLVISVVSGVLAGLLLRLPLLENLTQDDLYSDHRFWQIPARQSSPCRAHTQVGPHTHSHPHDPAHATTHHKHQQIQSLAHNNNTGP